MLLVSLLGRAAGRHLHALAHNLDARRVTTGRRRGSIGSQRARGRGPFSLERADADLIALVDRVTRRLRAARRVGRTVVLRLRFADFSRATRSRTLAAPTQSTAVVLATARELFAEAEPLLRERGLTLIGVAVANLADDRPLQLMLPLDRADDAPLDEAVDLVRKRFGSQALTRGVLVERDEGIAMPLLPD